MTDATRESEPAQQSADARPSPVSLADGDDLAALLDAESLVLLEFYTSGCGICASMEPVLGLVAKATDAVVATVNAGDDVDLAAEHRVQSVPTLVLFRDGEVVGRRAEGFVGAEELVDWVEARAG